MRFFQHLRAKDKGEFFAAGSFQYPSADTVGKKSRQQHICVENRFHEIFLNISSSVMMPIDLAFGAKAFWALRSLVSHK